MAKLYTGYATITERDGKYVTTLTHIEVNQHQNETQFLKAFKTELKFFATEEIMMRGLGEKAKIFYNIEAHELNIVL